MDEKFVTNTPRASDTPASAKARLYRQVAESLMPPARASIFNTNLTEADIVSFKKSFGPAPQSPSLVPDPTYTSHRGPWVRTGSGHKFYFLDPTPDMFEVRDIARGLSQTARFGGQGGGGQRFYSVAEHSVNVADVVSKISVGSDRRPSETFDGWLARGISPLMRTRILSALFHDGPEGLFLGDMATPIKRYLPDYQFMERRFHEVICRKLDLPVTLPFDVKRADEIMLYTEAPQLGIDIPVNPEFRNDPHIRLRFLNPPDAELSFMELYESLVG